MTLAYDVPESFPANTEALELNPQFFRDLQQFRTVQDVVTKKVFTLKSLSLNTRHAQIVDRESGKVLKVDIQTLQENFRSSEFEMPKNIACSTNQATCRVLN